MYTRVFLLDNFDNSIPKDGVDHEVNVTHRYDWPKKKISTFSIEYKHNENFIYRHTAKLSE